MSEKQKWRVETAVPKSAAEQFSEDLKNKIDKAFLNSQKDQEKYYNIELTTKVRHPDQKVFYIKEMGVDEAARPMFNITKNKEKAYPFTMTEAVMARRILEMSVNETWMSYNYAVVNA
jgi:hypothetical protein